MDEELIPMTHMGMLIESAIEASNAYWDVVMGTKTKTAGGAVSTTKLVESLNALVMHEPISTFFNSSTMTTMVDDIFKSPVLTMYVMDCTTSMFLKAGILGCEIVEAKKELVNCIQMAMMPVKENSKCLAPNQWSLNNYMTPDNIAVIFDNSPFMLFMYIHVAFINKTQFYQALVEDFKTETK